MKTIKTNNSNYDTLANFILVVLGLIAIAASITNLSVEPNDNSAQNRKLTIVEKKPAQSSTNFQQPLSCSEHVMNANLPSQSPPRTGA